MNKKLSQVFLKNEQILEKISKAIGATKKDVVFEIGGGKGPLTKYLVKTAKKVIVVEIDKKLIPYLRNYKVEIINKNFLKVNIPKEVTLIAGNIPYHLSGKITQKILQTGKRCIILYQKEFAQRLVAHPGNKEYSRISVLAQTMSKPKLFFNVNKHDFVPVPKVDSTLVEFIPKNVKYNESFFKFVKILFQFKNKTVKNALVFGRRHWTIEKDKRKLKPLLEEISDRKVVTLNINELKNEFEKFSHHVQL